MAAEPGALDWDLSEPFLIDILVGPEAIDHYGHVNNAQYLRWVEQASWAHSGQLGLTLEDYRALDRAMAVHRHELDYLAPGFEGECLAMATWIIACDSRLTLTRRFQLMRPRDGITLLRARTRYACIALSSGRLRRLPREFVQAYGGALATET
ncbi:acyl-CoA thioesterase [Halomonas borealis]|uniref:acyl-CoA thioesterase n=1 Tax=Halomonas borealis TaxID=2508710 RepID=UPI0010A05237|nr:thioesterase family protein [Halomonas borealis]